MRVTRVAWATYQVPLLSPWVNAHGVVALREGVLVRLDTDSGVSGYGEAATLPWFGHSRIADIVHLVDRFAPSLVGLTLDRAERLLVETDLAVPGAAPFTCALDTAICDIRARWMGLTLSELLGGDPTRAVHVNATVAAPEPETAAKAAKTAVHKGFDCIKLKVGVARSLPAEVERIARVREAMGPFARLRLDANGAWDSQTAIALIRAVQDLDIEMVEQPVPADDLNGMARVRLAVGVRVAADEAVADPRMARRVVAAQAADVLVVKPMLAGGLRPAREMIEMAYRSGLDAVVTTTIDSGVGVAAALHLATLLPQSATALACGLATTEMLADDLTVESIKVVRGIMGPPPGPGLGVQPDASALQRYGTPWTEAA